MPNGHQILINEVEAAIDIAQKTMDADKHNDGEEDQYGRRDCLEDQTPPAVVVKKFMGKASEWGTCDENNSQD